MRTNDPILEAVLAAFESARQSFESARLLLAQIVDEASTETSVEWTGECPHRDAFEVTTLGDGAPVWLCPDCGEQIG